MMNRRVVPRSERGSSLIEALVATALVGVALIALTATLSTLAVAGRVAGNQASAQAAVRAEVARIKAGPYDASGAYPCDQACTDALPSGMTRSLTVERWTSVATNCKGSNDAICWTANPVAVDHGAQRITVGYARDGTTVASLQLIKVNK